MYLVTGGIDSSGYALSTTELLIQGESSWVVLSVSGDLPQSRAALRSVSVNNEIIVSGGDCSCSIGATYDTIVKFKIYEMNLLFHLGLKICEMKNIT